MSNRVCKLVIGNTLEAFWQFLTQLPKFEELEPLCEAERMLSDRALFYESGRKLVVTYNNVPHFKFLKNLEPYKDIELIFPSHKVSLLSTEFLGSPEFINVCKDFCAESEKLKVSAYCSTHSLIKASTSLARELKLELVASELGTIETLSIRDHADSKIGFRSICDKLRLSAIVPRGFICTSTDCIAKSVKWFHDQGTSCIVKSDIGEGGLGNIYLKCDEDGRKRRYPNCADKEFSMAHMSNRVVEELVVTGDNPSPSIEFNVPPPALGRPQLAYVCVQTLSAEGEFYGMKIGKSVVDTELANELFTYGYQIACYLQSFGYVGYLDVDAIVSKSGKLYLIEANIRRTGGTHVHEFAVNTIGKEYYTNFYVISDDAMITSISNYQQLEDSLVDVLFPIDGKPIGVVPTVTSGLTNHNFGCMIFHSSEYEAKRLYEKVERSIA